MQLLLMLSRVNRGRPFACSFHHLHDTPLPLFDLFGTERPVLLLHASVLCIAIHWVFFSWARVFLFLIQCYFCRPVTKQEDWLKFNVSLHFCIHKDALALKLYHITNNDFSKIVFMLTPTYYLLIKTRNPTIA